MSAQSRTIGFIGPGLMGKGMAKNLIKAGFSLIVYFHQNRKPVQELVEMGAEETSDLSTIAKKSQVIITVLPGSAEVEEVTLGEKGIIHDLKPDTILIDCSTSYPASTRKLGAKIEQRGAHMLDAPLTRGPKEAEEGTLTIIVGGDKTFYKQCVDLFKIMGENIFYVGPLGTGHTIKLINNFLGISNLAAICQILTLAAKQGINMKAIYDVVSASGGNSAAFQLELPSILNRDFEVAFKLATARKDLLYVENLSRETEVPLPTADATLLMLNIAKAFGYGDDEYTSMVKAWEKLAEIEVKW